MTQTSASTSTPCTSTTTGGCVHCDERAARVAAARNRLPASGLWPETPDTDPEPTADPAADTLGWADR